MRSESSSNAVITALSALAHDHRLQAFRMLVQAGRDGVSAGEIARTLGLPNSSLSFHLGQLQQAGLIAQRREGRSLIYSADYAAMDDLIGFLTENCCAGDVCEVLGQRADDAIAEPSSDMPDTDKKVSTDGSV